MTLCDLMGTKLRNYCISRSPKFRVLHYGTLHTVAMLLGLVCAHGSSQAGWRFGRYKTYSFVTN